MELFQIIVSMLGLMIFLLVLTTFISYVAYRIKKNNLSRTEQEEDIGTIPVSDFRASPATIIYRPEFYRTARHLPLQEDTYRRKMHSVNSGNRNRYTIVNYGTAGQSFESQYFMPKELRRVG